MRARDSIRDGFKFKLGNRLTSIWYQDWTGRGKIAEHLDFVHISDTNLKLRDLVQNNSWSLDRLSTMLPPEMSACFSAVNPHIEPNSADIWYWEGSTTGAYSVKDGYAWLYNHLHQQQVLEDWKWVWKLQVPEKVRYFIWLCLHEALPINATRFNRHLATSASCSHCSSTFEDSLHALRDCRHSRELWTRLGADRWHNIWNQDVKVWLTHHARGAHATKFLAGLWNIWKWRCNMCLDPQPWTVEVAWRKLCQEHDEFMSILLPDSLEGGSDGLRITWKPSQ